MEEITFAFLATRPEFTDPELCKTALVGPMRSYLIEFGSLRLLSEFPDMPAAIAKIIERRNVAGQRMADFCARCGRCEWADLR